MKQAFIDKIEYYRELIERNIMSKAIVYFDQLFGYGRQTRDLSHGVDTSVEANSPKL